MELVRKDVRSFATTSVGRLFDSAAALLGFTRAISFEGQAAMWLEDVARRAGAVEAYPFPFSDRELDFRPLLRAVAHDRMRGRSQHEIARAFQRGVAQGLRDVDQQFLVSDLRLDTVVLSGGVFQNELLLHDLQELLPGAAVEIWTNHFVPPNDGGISLGQAALAAFVPRGPVAATAVSIPSITQPRTLTTLASYSSTILAGWKLDSRLCNR